MIISLTMYAVIGYVVNLLYFSKKFWFMKIMYVVDLYQLTLELIIYVLENDPSDGFLVPVPRDC